MYGLMVCLILMAIIWNFSPHIKGPRGLLGPRGVRGRDGPAGLCCSSEGSVKPIIKDVGGEVWLQNRNAVVSLTMEFKNSDGKSSFFFGSAFFISEDGYLATAAHNIVTNDSEGEGFVEGLHLGRASRVIASVTGWDGTDQVRTAECRIVGVDGAGDIGVLKIEDLKSQTHVRFGDSLNTLRNGDTVFLLGDPLGQDAQSCSHGVVRDNTYVDPSGNQPVESVLVDCIGYGGNSGSPVFDSRGLTVAIYTFGLYQTEGFGGGASQAILQPVAEAIVEADRGNVLYPGGDQVDQRGDYRKGFSGIIWNTYRAIDQVKIGFEDPHLIGILVGRAGPPWNSELRPQDLVLSLDDEPMGNLPGFRGPSVVTWKKKPGDTVRVRYQRRLTDGTTRTKTVILKLGSYPWNLDYPLSSWSNIEELGNRTLSKLVSPIRIGKNVLETS